LEVEPGAWRPLTPLPVFLTVCGEEAEVSLLLKMISALPCDQLSGSPLGEVLAPLDDGPEVEV